MKRIGIALAIALSIYGVAVGAGAALYATGTIATGATHNSCADFKGQIAKERGIAEEDVPQVDIKNATKDCLAQPEHTLSEGEALRSEYLLGAIWPAVVCAMVFLAWPVWARVLSNQEEAERTAAG